MGKSLKISELAAKTACPIQTIRYYEREGLLPQPRRTSGNYRIYGTTHIDRLLFIRHCRYLDMTLDEIRRLLKFCDAPRETCREVDELLDEHISHVGGRIAELQSLERQLRQLRRLCTQASAGKSCGILRGLADSRGAPESTVRSHVRGAHDRARSDRDG